MCPPPAPPPPLFVHAHQHANIYLPYVFYKSLMKLYFFLTGVYIMLWLCAWTFIAFQNLTSVQICHRSRMPGCASSLVKKYA